ncbi:MAG TPA: hypothetical protein VGC81_04325 [Candidatus Methylomirabilis sp.]|jgi:hypothetical protein
MPTLIHKVQVLVDDQQHRALLALAKAQGKPLSVLLREAVVEQLLKKARRTAKQKAFEEIAAMDLPVGEWSEMEKEIERTHGGGRRR